jgi:hypothetical protein
MSDPSRLVSPYKLSKSIKIWKSECVPVTLLAGTVIRCLHNQPINQPPPIDSDEDEDETEDDEEETEETLDVDTLLLEL